MPYRRAKHAARVRKIIYYFWRIIFKVTNLIEIQMLNLYIEFIEVLVRREKHSILPPRLESFLRTK